MSPTSPSAPSGSLTVGEAAPKEVVGAFQQRKKPPLESPESIRTRRLVICSVWAVVIFLGLPVWWKTTEVYRAALPLQVMTNWAEGKICELSLPLEVAVIAPSLSRKDAQHVVDVTQATLDERNDLPQHTLKAYLVQDSGATGLEELDSELLGTSRGLNAENRRGENALVVNLVPFDAEWAPKAELRGYAPVMDVFYRPSQVSGPSPSLSTLTSLIAEQLEEIFREERAMFSHLLSHHNGSSAQAMLLSREHISALERRQTRSFKYAPTYHLTFSLFSASAAPSDWDIESAVDQYFRPFLQPVSSISNFTIDSQVQLYSHLSPSIQQPQYDPVRKRWTIRKEDLSGFINAAEWPLTPSIGPGPTINFAVYVPSADQSPLEIEENGGTSWLVPQWGGVTILNPPSTDSKHTNPPRKLTTQDLEPALSTFTHQLSLLLGLPDSPPSLPIRLDTLTRYHALSLIFSASSTLGALARLTRALPSIAIPDTVARNVDHTIAHLDRACSSLQEGRFRDALANARVAEAEAEKAFFERSMVGQVYFPEEHKVAVYLPLLGPVAVPLVLAAVKEVRRTVREGW